MKIAQLLCWFDEPREFLSASVASAARAGCTAVAALDGRFAQFDTPGERFLSPRRQRTAIEDTCSKLGLDLIVYQPPRPWHNEPEKRTAMFRMGDALDVDWFFVNDADCVIRPCRLPDLLRDVAEDACWAVAHTPSPPGVKRLLKGPALKARFRPLFRAIPGIQVVTNHYTFVTPDGRYLWQGNTEHPAVDARDLSKQVRILHRTYYRPVGRNERQYDYYRQRDSSGVEAGLCLRCKKNRATFQVPAGMKLLADGDIEGDWTFSCGRCRDEMVRLAQLEAARLGADIETVEGLRHHIVPLGVA